MPNEILKHFRSYNIFTAADARLFLRKMHRGNTRLSNETVQVTLSRMVNSGKLYSVTKGIFSTTNRTEVSGFAFAPFYYGGLSALMIRSLIDDQVAMEIMTTKKIRKTNVMIFDHSISVILHHIPNRLYFGFDDIAYGSIVIPVSNPEKTLIDLFFYKIKLSLPDYSELLRTIDRSKVTSYLSKYDQHTQKTVNNFLNRYKTKADKGELESGY